MPKSEFFKMNIRNKQMFYISFCVGFVAKGRVFFDGISKFLFRKRGEDFDLQNECSVVT